VAEDHQRERPARATDGPVSLLDRVPDRVLVLPCVDSMVHAGRLLALRTARELDLLAITLPSTLLFRVQSDSPDVIVVAEGAAFLAKAGNRNTLQEVFAETPAVLLAAEVTTAIVRSAARMNIHSVIPMEADTPQLVTAISATLAGFAVTPPLRPAASAYAMRITEELTAREVEVLRLMARGQTNKQVAAQLRISEHTAKFHVSSVLTKLGARTRTEAVTIGMTRGVVAI
jgi:DNA-binding NarL/FixJ family response regulator